MNKKRPNHDPSKNQRRSPSLAGSASLGLDELRCFGTTGYAEHLIENCPEDLWFAVDYSGTLTRKKPWHWPKETVDGNNAWVLSSAGEWARTVCAGKEYVYVCGLNAWTSEGLKVHASLVVAINPDNPEEEPPADWLERFGGKELDIKLDKATQLSLELLLNDIYNPEPYKNAKRLKRMAVTDCGMHVDGLIATFQCKRCLHETPWIYVIRSNDIRTGIPCHKCNEGIDLSKYKEVD
jgi:hypothetical protein